MMCTAGTAGTAACRAAMTDIKTSTAPPVAGFAKRGLHAGAVPLGFPEQRALRGLPSPPVPAGNSRWASPAAVGAIYVLTDIAAAAASVILCVVVLRKMSLGSATREYVSTARCPHKPPIPSLLRPWPPAPGAAPASRCLPAAQGAH